MFHLRTRGQLIKQENVVEVLKLKIPCMNLLVNIILIKELSGFGTSLKNVKMTPGIFLSLCWNKFIVVFLLTNFNLFLITNCTSSIVY